jgi:hypothetical protein
MTEGEVPGMEELTTESTRGRVRRGGEQRAAEFITADWGHEQSQRPSPASKKLVVEGSYMYY